MSGAACPKRLCKHSSEADHHSAEGRLLIGFATDSSVHHLLLFPVDSRVFQESRMLVRAIAPRSKQLGDLTGYRPYLGEVLSRVCVVNIEVSPPPRDVSSEGQRETVLPNPPTSKS
jgi:hypothetical protein